MVLFVFTLVLMFSLSAVLYLMVRALPRVTETNGTVALGGADGASVGGGSKKVRVSDGIERHGLLDRWAHSEIPEKIDGAFNSWLLKFLRKFKVFVLKLDNAVSNHLSKIHHENKTAEKKAAIDFKEISGQNKEDEN